jgi:hypothetical protein
VGGWAAEKFYITLVVVKNLPLDEDLIDPTAAFLFLEFI